MFSVYLVNVLSTVIEIGVSFFSPSEVTNIVALKALGAGPAASTSASTSRPAPTMISVLPGLTATIRTLPTEGTNFQGSIKRLAAEPKLGIRSWQTSAKTTRKPRTATDSPKSRGVCRQ